MYLLNYIKFHFLKKEKAFNIRFPIVAICFKTDGITSIGQTGLYKNYSYSKSDSRERERERERKRKRETTCCPHALMMMIMMMITEKETHSGGSCVHK